MAATHSYTKVYTCTPFVIQKTVYTAIADTDAIDVPIATGLGAPSKTAPLLVIPLFIATATADIVKAEHIVASDVIASNTVRVLCTLENGGTIGSPTLEVTMIWLDHGQQDGQSINADNNT